MTKENEIEVIEAIWRLYREPLLFLHNNLYLCSRCSRCWRLKSKPWVTTRATTTTCFAWQ